MGDGNATGDQPSADEPSVPDEPVLPPADSRAVRVLACPGAVVQRFDPTDVVADAVTALDPTCVVGTAPDATVVAPAIERVVDATVATASRGRQPVVEAGPDGRCVVVVASRLDGLPDRPAACLPDAAEMADDSPERVCLVTDALSLTVDPTRRETTVEGLTAYRDHLPDAWVSPTVVHASTALPPGYSGRVSGPTEDASLQLHGLGPAAVHRGVGIEATTDEVAVLDVYPNGAVATTTHAATAFGLRAIDGVSDARAAHLREAGLDTRTAVAEAPVDALTALPSVGQDTATAIQASARAVAEGTVVATGTGSLPEGDPVFVDIETDGLAASTAWLVGVLDGDAESGSYMAFRQRQPNTGDHLEAFMTWLTGSAAGRPVVAWNGLQFDFPVIRDQLQTWCPASVEAWESRYTFDPLHWAREQGNAALPGRTNELERVAAPLGWTPTTTGIDGGTVADVYVRWRDRTERADDPTTVAEPDWERLEAYCEDDVRALATIYAALEDAARREPTTDRTTRSTQGRLSDFD